MVLHKLDLTIHACEYSPGWAGQEVLNFKITLVYVGISGRSGYMKLLRKHELVK